MAHNSKREALILALLRSPSLKAAAHKAGVSYATAKRYAAEEGFLAELAQAKRDAFGQALAVLQGSSARAAATLLRNLRSEKASDRNTAAAKLLDFAFQGHMALDLAAKLAEVETLLRGKTDAETKSERPAQKGRRTAGRGAGAGQRGRRG